MANGHSFLDFEIHIAAPRDAYYPVHIRLSDGQDFGGELAADLAAWTSSGNPQADGRALFEALFAASKLREAWGLARGAEQRRIRLWLDADAPELHALPWELLHDGQTFLAADAAIPFSRYLPSAAPWGGLVAERPIRILAVIANPDDLAQHNLAPLDVGAECALLTDALGDLAPKHFRLETLEAPVTLERLERALASGPHVLHFVGHGAFGKRSQKAVLYLQDAAGNTQIVTDAQLCDILHRQGKIPSLIFLAACQSAERSTVDAFAGLAPKLVQAGVPAVVAMQDSVAIAATRKLTPVFYEELARHGEVDRALNAARSLLLTGQSPDAATPVLLMRLKDGKLWEPLWAKTNPYRGLAAFTEADVAFFFGRERLITELSDKVRRQRFIAVVGPSGSGKSSVVQAGLLPRLPKDWKIIKLRPGSDPYAAIDLSNFLRSDRSEKRQVIFIDQFEELFTLCSSDVQTRFLDDLQALITSPIPITVILTLRADFFGHLQASPLGKHLEHTLVNVLPMEPTDLRTAIERPAQAVGLRFEAGLVETVVEDARQARHTLPLLQFALTQMWERQTEGVLTYTAYQQAGGVAEAIGLWAEDAYNGLMPEEQRLAHRIFTRLVHYGEGDAADTRQRRTLSELLVQPDEHDNLHRLLQKLADARLLTTGETHGVESVEIIHDALLKEWFRLAQWLAEQREFHLWRQRLEAQLQLWEEKGRDDSALLRGALLIEAERWSQEKPEELNQQEQTYIRAGIDSREYERQAHELRRRRILAGTVTIAILLLGLALIAGIGWRSSTTKEQARATAQAEAVAEATRALNAETTAQAEANRARDAEATAQAEAVRALSAEATAEAHRQNAENAQATAEARRIDAENAQATAEARRIDAENAQATAEANRVEAERQTSIALSRQLAANALIQLNEDHWESALLLAIEAGYAADTLEASTALREAISHRGRTLKIFSGIDSLWQQGLSKPALWSKNGDRILVHGFGTKVKDVLTGEDLLSISSNKVQTYSAIWNVDESRILTAGCDQGSFPCTQGSARVWDSVTGEELLTLSGYTGRVYQATWNADETLILTAGCDLESPLTCLQGSARVWDAKTGKELLVLTKGLGGVYQAQWSTDGSRILTASSDGITRIWNATTGETIRAMFGHSGAVYEAFWNERKGRILTVGHDNTVRVWNAETGEELLSILAHNDSTVAVTWNKDATYILTSGCDRSRNSSGLECLEGSARIWDAQTGKLMLVMPKHGDVWDATWNTNESYVLTASEDGAAQVWDVETGEVLFTMLGHDWFVTQATWSNDENRILTIGWGDNTLRIWDVKPGAELAVLSGYSAIWSKDESQILTWKDIATWVWDAATGEKKLSLLGSNALWNKDETLILTTSSTGAVRIFDAKSGYKKIVINTYIARLLNTFWSADASRIMTVGCDRVDEYNTNCLEGKITIWDAATGSKILTISYDGGWQFGEGWDNDENHILASNSIGDIFIWDAKTGERLNTFLGHTARISQVVWNNNQSRILTVSWDGTVRVWDVTTGEELLQLPAVDIVWQAMWNKDESLILTSGCDSSYVNGCNNGSARIWDANTGEMLFVFSDYTGGVHAAWNSDETLVMTRGDGGWVKVWNARTGKEMLSLYAHKGGVTQAVWNANETRILTSGCEQIGAACSKGAARVWDARTGEELYVLTGHAGNVLNARWNNDETRILTVGEDGVVRLWYAELKDLLSEACQRAPRNMTYDEWRQFMKHESTYHLTCPNLPEPENGNLQLQP